MKKKKNATGDKNDEKIFDENFKDVAPKEDQTDITPEAQDAGFHNFPQTEKLALPWKSFELGSGILIALVILLFVAGGIPAFATYRSAKKVAISLGELEASVKAQDLDQIKTSLEKVESDFKSLDKNIVWLGWIKFIPFIGSYVKDAQAALRGGTAGIEAGKLVLKTIEPYSDILGFGGGEQAEDGQKTAEERINFIVETIDDIVPQLDEISNQTATMVEEFNKINPDRYPEEFKSRKIRGPLRSGIETVNQIHKLVSGGKPVLAQAPYLLGIDTERSYLFLWQNDKELRSTGGFITAYSLIKVKNGKFIPGVSNDIYNLDARFNSRVPAPEPIKKYLPLVPYWNLRDMNLSPDFKVSMETFSEHYPKTRAPAYDGIIAMDTKLVVDLLEVIGPIGVPGFGNFSAENDPRCNCPVVIYELESFADRAGPIVWDDISGQIVYKPPHADNRKEILGPLMNSVLANAMGQPKEKIPDLFNTGFNALLEKHVMFYFPDQEKQKAMESFNLSGRIVETEYDYLHVNDTNFAGAKSNLYVEETVDLKVEPGKNGGTNTLVVKYSNPQKHDGWLNGPYRDWVRVYVPKGSELLESTGSEVEVKTSEDLGKTVFEGFFTLRPLGVIELTFKYRTPIKENGNYKIMVQKQPGTDGHLYTVELGGQKEEFYLKTDKELSFQD